MAIERLYRYMKLENLNRIVTDLQFLTVKHALKYGVTSKPFLVA